MTDLEVSKNSTTPAMVAVKQIVWINGVPTPSTAMVIPKESVSDIAMAALSLPYKNPDPETYPQLSQYDGMSNLEVALIMQAKNAANGGQDALALILDRAVGRPKQTIESKRLNLNYEDYLDSLKSADIELTQKDAGMANAQEEFTDL